MKNCFILRGPLVFVFCAMHVFGTRAAEPSQRDVALWLENQAKLVKSADIEFTVTTLPTRPDEVRRLVSLDPQNRSFVYSEVAALAISYRSKWLRKGPKEFQETSPLEQRAKDSGRRTTAFDGNILRALVQPRTGPPAMYLDSLETGHWNVENRVQPFALCFEYVRRPFWEIVRDSPNCNVTRSRHGGKDMWDVSVVHPQLSDLRFVLVFDAEFRLVRRDKIMKWPTETAARLYQRDELQGYKAYEDSSGERIWFPSNATLHYYAVVAPDGPVEHLTRVVDVSRARFNVDVPDETFSLNTPGNARIYDRLTGRGWLHEEPARQARKAATASRNMWLIGAGIALPLFILALFLLRRRAQLA